jgi:CheY-like chemotaxis protein
MNNSTILIAEDDGNDVLLLRRAFERARSLVALQFVDNGEDALAYLSGDYPYSNRNIFPFPELLLLDLKMPRIDGFELLEAARAHPFMKRLPIIILSASDRPRDIALAMELGANSVLRKPATLTGLCDLVRSMENYWLKLNLAASVQTAQIPFQRNQI